MLTIEDIRNPKRKSGFSHVHQNGTTNKTVGWMTRVQKARDDGRPGSQTVWQGTRRRTPEEAAQDYCDYVNGQEASPPVALKAAGHVYTIDEGDTDPEYQQALGVLRDRKAQRSGRPGYVYCIAHMERMRGGGFNYVKVGYSVNPQKRVAELQTGNPYPLKLIALKPGTEADERYLHSKYIKDNVLQEWFVASSALLLEFTLRPDGTPYAKEVATA